jgi:hypothetical protein
VDCRPIYVRRTVAVNGFDIVKTRRTTILGLPVEIVLARKPNSRTAAAEAVEKVGKAGAKPGVS